MVDAVFISSFFFYLVLLSFSLASIQLFHPTHGLCCFILCYLSWVYTCSIMFIPHCKYFFLSSCTRNMAHNAVNTRSQSLLHRKYTCTRPVRQMPFGVTTLKIEDCTPVNHTKNKSMQRYAHLDVNLARKKIRILTFVTLKITLQFKIQRGIHTHLFQYTMNY